MIFLYRLTSPSGKSYIGITTDVGRRRRTHKRIALSGAKPSHPLYRAIVKYGMDKFAVDVLDQYGTPDEAKAGEAAAIDRHQTLAPGGYNVSRGGDYDGDAGGRAVVEKMATDETYRARRAEIGRATIGSAHQEMERRDVAKQIARNTRATKPLRYISTETTGGVEYVYFRRRPEPKVRMLEPMWSDAFMARYKELVSTPTPVQK